ncbi:MAG: winged helix-turn-helix transcriptional regulator [Promethearchaeota archaeon]
MPAKKVNLSMSLSTKKVLRLLKQEGTLRMEDISSSLPNYTGRTLRNAIKQLKQLELIDSQPDLRDMRRRFYSYKKIQN